MAAFSAALASASSFLFEAASAAACMSSEEAVATSGTGLTPSGKHEMSMLFCRKHFLMASRTLGPLPAVLDPENETRRDRRGASAEPFSFLSSSFAFVDCRASLPRRTAWIFFAASALSSRLKAAFFFAGASSAAVAGAFAAEGAPTFFFNISILPRGDARMWQERAAHSRRAVRAVHPKRESPRARLPARRKPTKLMELALDAVNVTDHSIIKLLYEPKTKV